MTRIKKLEEESRCLKKRYIEAQIKADIIAEGLAKSLRPSRRREVARCAVKEKGLSIGLASETFGLSESEYRYQSQLNAENARIAERLQRLTENHRKWGFGFCFSLPSERVTRSLEQIMQWCGTPKVLRSDSGPEYISESIVNWAKRRGIRMQYIQPEKPQQNAYVERFNRTVRYEWLAPYCFDVISEVQNFATRRIWNYNGERPNMALGGITLTTAASHGCVTPTSQVHRDWSTGAMLCGI